MSEQTTTYKDILTILQQPRVVFAKIKFEGGCWKPIFFLSALFFIMTMIYQSHVDHEWLADKQVKVLLDIGLVQPENVTAFKSDLVEKSSSSIQFWTQSVIAVFSPVVMAFIFSLYFSLVGNIITDEYRFADWFRFACWALVPVSISLLGSMIGILLSDNGRLMPDDADIFTLSYLFSGFDLSEKWHSLLGIISVSNILCWYLSIIGLRTWTEKSYVSCSFIVLLPVILIAVAIAYFA